MKKTYKLIHSQIKRIIISIIFLFKLLFFSLAFNIFYFNGSTVLRLATFFSSNAVFYFIFILTGVIVGNRLTYFRRKIRMQSMNYWV